MCHPVDYLDQCLRTDRHFLAPPANFLNKISHETNMIGPTIANF